MKSEMPLQDMLKEGAREFSVELDDEKLSKLLEYKELLIEWNKKINLTAIEEDRDIIIKHFIDSFSILPSLKRAGESIIDIGTGAGFPGIPVKIVDDSKNIVLLDSLQKRINFLDIVIENLALSKIKAVHGRAEDMGVNPLYREKFNVAVARAVANLPVLLEYCLPFVKTGGLFIAMKGSSVEEINASNKALEVLGGKIEEIREFTLPFSDISRNIIIIKKIRPTPTKYPRKSGKPSKEPLV